MAQTRAFVYTEKYFDFDYGPHHPLRIERLKLTHALMNAYGLFDLPNLILEETIPTTVEYVGRFHRPEYIDQLIRNSRGENDDVEAALNFGLGPGDNPIFRGLWEWSLLTAGASLQSAKIVAEGRADLAFNIAGGLHHAMANRASGFCYVNDIVVAIKYLVELGARVAYVDVDAHHGDGVEAAFLEDDRVLTVSLHQHGRTLFPGTGFVYEAGRGRGLGYAVNAPLYPGTDDEIFLEVFHNLVPDLVEAFRPDILVTQLGVDTLLTDPLTNLCLTTNGFLEMVRTFKEMGLPWLALGGGGYHIVNVARAWTLAWALMNDVRPPENLPEPFLQVIRKFGYREEKLRDEPYRSKGAGRADAETAARQATSVLRETVLPIIKRRQRRA
jgi:acetoin utilization protein AcuC